MIPTIKFLFVVLFVGGLFGRYSTPSVQRILCDCSVMAIVTIALFRPHVVICKYAWWILGYLLLVLLSFIVNQVSLSDFCFYFFRYYQNMLWLLLLVLFFWDYPFSRESFKSLLNFLIVMWLLQIVIACSDIWITQQRTEGWVGFMTSSGGGLATLFSIAVLAFFLVWGTFYRKIWYWFAMMVPLVGFASNKRGIFYLVPLVIALTFFLILLKNKLCPDPALSGSRIARRFFYFGMILLLLTPGVVWSINNTRFAYSNSISQEDSGSPITFLIQIIERYLTEGESEKFAETADRLSTTKLVWMCCMNDPKSALVGVNPLDGIVFDIIDDSGNNGRLLQYGIGYGMTGVISDCFSAGFIATGLVLLFIIVSIVELFMLDTRNWDECFKYTPLAFSAYGCAGLINHLFYSTDFFMRPCSIFPYAIFTMAFLSLSRKPNHIFLPKEVVEQ